MSDHDFRDSRLAADVGADLLARQMTVTEKCYQLTAVPPWWLSRADGTGPAGLHVLLSKAPGHVCNFVVDTPDRLANLGNAIQRTAVERTRLGGSIRFHAEALNGFPASPRQTGAALDLYSD